MSSRVQVILSNEEKARLQREARRQGMSLSAWLRRAALERLAAGDQGGLTTRADIQRFFEACDLRELGQEPDWEEHLQVIGRSRGQGASDT
jgi:hypothetical protein